MEYIFQRKIYEQISQWKRKNAGRSNGNRLYFYTWPKDERHNYEIDFLLSRGAKVCPLEIKSSNHKNHVSLDTFCEKFSSRIDNRYLVCTKDLRLDGKTTILPIYMTGLI